ncbi:MAG: FAD-dependent oxidoreductase [Acidobacteria bacterium]|nr:FAD-dependent oxidoreductase [Acidobacteriota bacterium]
MGVRGASVLVVGAGLAGLAAAWDLHLMGARVLVIDARDRVGGRVWTVGDAFVESQHAEAGGDMIDEAHREIRTLAADVGLTLTRILRHGFGAVRLDRAGRPRTVHSGARHGWARLAHALAPVIRPYCLAEQRWDSPIASALARKSVADWLDEIAADADLRATADGLRGFFLADPDELSLLALVDQFAAGDAPAPGAMYRIEGGNDRLPRALACRLGDRVRLRTELVALSQRGPGVRATVRDWRGTSTCTGDYAVITLPLTVLRRIPISPGLPAQQREAIAAVPYGRATKTLLQFRRPFWRRPGRLRAFGSPLDIGAVWDANEEQHGPGGILALLAGGSASDATAAITRSGGAAALAGRLQWLGRDRSELVGSRQAGWTADRWARGGYAFFPTGFDPALRAWLARPCGRLFFAGEHTSIRWQGYMNGAVESGRRAAAEIACA